MVILGVAVFVLGFLLLGMQRALGFLSWRLEQLEATTPKRLGRGSLKPGKRAPESAALQESVSHSISAKEVEHV
jgi:hypothetical protein